MITTCTGNMFLLSFAISVVWMTDVATAVCSTRCQEIVDLSHPYNKDMQEYPLLPPFVLNVTIKGVYEKIVGLQLEDISCSTHSGTHIDAPCHIGDVDKKNKERWFVDEIPMKHLIAPCAVIDISHKVEVNPDALVEKEDLEYWEEVSGMCLDGTIILMRFGWGYRWSNQDLYLGTPDKNPDNFHYPGISEGAARWLVKNRNVYGVGTEALTLNARNFDPNRIFYGRDIYVLNNVANLDRLPTHGAMLHVGPMKISKACGAPTRIVATFPKRNSRCNSKCVPKCPRRETSFRHLLNM